MSTALCRIILNKLLGTKQKKKPKRKHVSLSQYCITSSKWWRWVIKFMSLTASYLHWVYRLDTSDKQTTLSDFWDCKMQTECLKNSEDSEGTWGCSELVKNSLNFAGLQAALREGLPRDSPLCASKTLTHTQGKTYCIKAFTEVVCSNIFRFHSWYYLGHSSAPPCHGEMDKKQIYVF